MIRHLQPEPPRSLKHRVLRMWPVITAVLIFVVASVVILSVSWPDPTPSATGVELPANVGFEQKLNEPIPMDVVFKDESGRDIALGDYFTGKPVILNLVYFRCPMLCNMAMDGLIRSLRGMNLSAGQDFTVVTVSFDPREGPTLAAGARDTALRRYGREGAADGWHFLTGDQPSIDTLADAVGFDYTWDEQRGQYAHPAVLVVATPDGKLSRYFSGIEYPARDLRLGLVEASDGKIGTAADHVLLMCYQYDPTTGKYGLVIMNIIRIAGTATLLLLAASIYMMATRVVPCDNLKAGDALDVGADHQLTS